MTEAIALKLDFALMNETRRNVSEKYRLSLKAEEAGVKGLTSLL